MTAIQCVLFDLGGVLIEVAGPPFSADAAQMSEAEIWDRWLCSVAVRRFESGRSEPTTFAREIIAEMALQTTPETFVRQFTAWPGKPFPDAIEMLAQLKPRVKVACLSNTNALHWQRFEQESQLIGLFDHPLPSFQTGHMKPDRAAYEHAVTQLALEPHQVLFFDDNQRNVDAARAYGLLAELTRGTTDAEQHLKRHGLL